MTPGRGDAVDRYLGRLDLGSRERLDRLLDELVDVLDSLDRLLDDRTAEKDADDGPLRGSVRAIARQLDRTVVGAGLVRFGEPGEALDLDRHVVVGTGPGDTDTVAAVERAGYERDGRVIRPADVIVGDGRTGGQQ